MRFEPRRAFLRSKLYSARRLPAEIAFLAKYIDRGEVLWKAARRARGNDSCAARSLMAYGDISESLYYRCLAHHLDVPFVEGWPQLAETFDLVAALRLGQAKQADGTWLLAPTGVDLKRLLGTRAAIRLRRCSLTTPGHFAAIIRHRAPERLAYAASDQLPDTTPHLSARGAFDTRAKGVVGALMGLFGVGCWAAPTAAMDMVGIVFFAAMCFRLVVCAFGMDQIYTRPASIDDGDAAFYSVLVPLYHEAHMVAALIAALDRLDYPREKLEILILIEAHDHATRDALSALDLPPIVRVITVPDGSPRTKSRALNAGLLMARGAYVTVYDAEDRPDPNQLRIASSIFSQAPTTLACLQARLHIDDDNGSLLAHLFAAEYAILFDLFNVGIARLGLPLALGGTSNHFRMDALRTIGGWDAWNVTEDADLGLRLARFGYSTDVMDSITVEEPPRNTTIWLKQRRRWMKGWIQTFLVLAKHRRTYQEFGALRTMIIVLMSANMVIGPLLAPVFLALVLFDIVKFGVPAPRDMTAVGEATLFSSVMAIGTASSLWCGYQGLRIIGRNRRVDRLLCLLPYQLLISLAAWGGLYDLCRDPYHWHKTEHGDPQPGASPR